MRTKHLLTLMLALGAPAVASAQDPAVSQGVSAPAAKSSLEVRPFAAQTDVGTIRPVELTVTHPVGTTAVIESAPTSRRAQLIGQISTDVPDGDAIKTTFALRYGFFQPGTAIVQPIVVTIEGGKEPLTLTAPAMSVVVKPVLLAADSLSPVEPTVPLWVDDYTLLWVAGFGALAMLLGAGIVVSRRRNPIEAEPLPPRPPHEIALEKLLALEASELLSQGNYMIYVVRLSETTREYLGDRYGFPGTELTTTEIEERLDGVRWPAGIELDEISAVLRRCDVVKFGGVIPTHDEARAILRRAITIVELTRRRTMAPVPTTVPDATPDTLEHPPTDEEIADVDRQWKPPEAT